LSELKQVALEFFLHKINKTASYQFQLLCADVTLRNYSLTANFNELCMETHIITTKH